MTTLNLLTGVHITVDYSITTVEDSSIGVLTWPTTTEVPNKLVLINKNADGLWVFSRKKNTPILLNPPQRDIVDSESVIALWKQIPVYAIPKTILMGLYSHKVGAFEAIFGIRTVTRPRTDLGTDKVVTRPGTYLVTELVEAHISRPLIKALLDIGVFHMPKS